MSDGRELMAKASPTAISVAIPFPGESYDGSARGAEQRNGQLRYVRLDAEADLQPLSMPETVLICGKATKGLDLLPAESVRTVITSPPYWSLRDYDLDDRFGRDDTLRDYIANIVADFDKLRRVLTSDGTVWLNIGDAYTSGNRRYRAPDRKNRGARDVGATANTGWAEAEGSDRSAVARGVRPTGSWLVDSIRSDLEQTECASRVGL